MELKLQEGSTSLGTGPRQDKELAVYRLLDDLDVKYGRVDHEPAFTMEECSRIDEVLAPAVICKNLFLCNRQKTKFYLLMIKEDKVFKAKEISSQIGSSRLSFAPEEHMVELLATEPGSASVMGLMNDSENRVQLVIDEDVLKNEYVGCHPCVNTSSIRLKITDLLDKVLPAIHHNYKTAKLGMNEEI